MKEWQGAALTADGHVSEEEPASYEALLGAAGLLLHDVQVRWVEAEGGGRQAICNQVDPQQLYRDQGLGHSESCRQENTKTMDKPKRSYYTQ